MANSYYSIIEPILFTASRLEVIANRCIFRPIGMNISSVKIMSLLCRKKSMTPKEIMQLVGGTKSNISQRLDSLEKKGYIQTRKNTFDDGRKLSVELTEAGEEKLQEIKNHFRKVKLELESNFTREEIEKHFEFFNKLNRLVDLKEKDLSLCNHFCK
jgi:DNA-binding MarR family transcriptional regulator